MTEYIYIYIYIPNWGASHCKRHMEKTFFNWPEGAGALSTQTSTR